VQRYLMADIVEDRAQQRGSLGVEHVQNPRHLECYDSRGTRTFLQLTELICANF
jgi:hypothetical protein